MQTLSNTPLPLKLLGAALALALIIAVVLAVTPIIGPAAAQSPGNIYANPQPCGPGAETAFQPEPHEITEGHFALFDAYWEWLVQDPTDENVGLLHTNLCPPKLTQTTTTGRGGPQTVTTLTASGIDINEAIFHVLDTHKVTVVGDAQYDPSTSQLPAGQYLELVDDEHINVGSEVWWLRLDDPNTADVDETSDLALGFSTMRFDEQYWGGAADGGLPFRYKFELERDPGIPPENDPHLFVYRAREKGAATAELVWSSANADVKDMEMQPGQLEDLQWVFTQPGTYEIWVHLQGWVRHNPLEEAGLDWRPISEYTTETSEVKRYVVQVGSALDEVEPPRFGVNRYVTENSPAGTLVGDPIHVLKTDVETLEYRLSGEGHEDFALVPYTTAHSVQIVVADGAQLDYETQPVYDLTLGVTDNVDHESNPDDSLDDTLEVRIALDDVPTSAVIRVDHPYPAVGDTVTFTAVVTDFGEGYDVSYHFRNSHGGTATSPTYILQHNVPTTETVYLTASYQTDPSSDPISVDAPPVTITWRNP